MKGNLAIYARVSTEKQSQEGTIESQLSVLKEFVQNNGKSVDPDLVFIDKAVSGTTFVRPGLDALRDKAAAGQVDTIIILSPDRLARKYAHQLMLVEEFQKLGVEIIYVNRNI